MWEGLSPDHSDSEGSLDLDENEMGSDGERGFKGTKTNLRKTEQVVCGDVQLHADSNCSGQR